MERCDVAIVGAGPYGLSAAAHLRQLKGLDARLFGEPMSFWERHMPEGMQLRSPWAGSHIADPGNRLTLDVYRRVNGNPQLAEPVPLVDFIKYGHWFHQQLELSPDRRKVIRIELAPEGYRLTLEDGEALHARRVVVAAGIQPFAHRPKLFEGLPASLVTHTSEQIDYGRFRDKEVLVIGGGQSALEAGVFLHEAGAHVEVSIRNSVLHWAWRRRWMHATALGWMLYGRAEIGSAGISLVIQRPDLYRRLPRRIQDSWAARAIRPAVAAWLKPRTLDVSIHLGRFPVQARVEGEHLRVRFDDGTERVVDHVVLGTGYRIHVGLYPFFSSGLLERMDLVNGYPRLDAGFETSLPGLHILGAPAAWSFGPLMRFVAGTEFASPALRSRILQAEKRQLISHQGRDDLQCESLGLATMAHKSEG
jgi:cation diffusion facilitator CzcD-associated flavoprotein CzcO